MRMIFRSLLSLLYIFSVLPAQADNKIVYGSHIEKRVKQFFNKHQIDRKVIVSQKRAYFPCEEVLQVKPRINGDWSTIRVSCPHPKEWVVTLRTSSYDNNKGNNSLNNTHGFCIGNTTAKELYNYSNRFSVAKSNSEENMLESINKYFK